MSFNTEGQWVDDELADDTLEYSLLRNPFIQIESTEAIKFQCINFEFQ